MLEKFFPFFSYSSFGLITILIILLLTGIIPEKWYTGFLILAVIILIMRIILRIIYSQRIRNKH